MATIVEVNGLTPTIGDDVWLAPTAVLVGDVRVGDRAESRARGRARDGGRRRSGR